MMIVQKAFSGPYTLLALLLFVSGACMKDDTLAVVTTDLVTQITATTATSGGTIDRLDGSPPQEFGICWSTEPAPTVADSRTKEFINRSPTFLSSMEGLSPSTKYYVRAYSRNTVGIAYGNERSFTTQGIPVAMTTITLSDIKVDGSNFKASYTVDNADNAVINSGVCWNLTGEPTITSDKMDRGSGIGTFNVLFPNPGDNVMYYGRAFATTSIDTTYSMPILFGAVHDIDNNPYNFVKIETQYWLRENLRTTHFSNGDPIAEISSAPGSEAAWTSIGAAAFSQRQSGFPDDYRNYYNGFVVVDSRNVCPTGWHVPTRSDFNILISNAGGQSAGAKALKEAGNAHWSNNTSSTNSSRFTALPAGFRNESGVLIPTGIAIFWVYETINIPHMVGMRLHNSSDEVSFFVQLEKEGLSVRCVKN